MCLRIGSFLILQVDKGLICSKSKIFILLVSVAVAVKIANFVKEDSKDLNSTSLPYQCLNGASLVDSDVPLQQNDIIVSSYIHT